MMMIIAKRDTKLKRKPAPLRRLQLQFGLLFWLMRAKALHVCIAAHSDPDIKLALLSTFERCFITGMSSHHVRTAHVCTAADAKPGFTSNLHSD
jgi:hypothetical protein